MQAVIKAKSKKKTSHGGTGVCRKSIFPKISHGGAAAQRVAFSS
jgi:hypothetical protein